MRRIITGLTATLLIAFFLTFFFSIKANAQSDSQRVMIPGPIPQNAGFDVIVKLNGDIVYGLVKEVGPFFITYQRTDIPDGPIYSVPRNEVYVISYRNQVKDYINGMAGNAPVVNSQYPDAPRYINYKNKNLFDNSNVTVGLGFLRSFSKVQDVKTYSSSSSFPVLSFSYEVLYQKNIQLGIELGFGTHKFSNQQFSSYDSTNNNTSLKENIFGLYVYGRYFLSTSSSRLQPYILGGLGITSSNIISENKISFTNDNTQVILVKSGSRATGLGITARAGGEYYLNNQLQLFLDAGVGLSVIKFGLSISVNNEKH
ncbi:MAG: outer membrane beta-barrel protein [Ginsengibacter sp.]